MFYVEAWFLHFLSCWLRINQVIVVHIQLLRCLCRFDRQSIEHQLHSTGRKLLLGTVCSDELPQLIALKELSKVSYRKGKHSAAKEAYPLNSKLIHIGAIQQPNL